MLKRAAVLVVAALAGTGSSCDRAADADLVFPIEQALMTSPEGTRFDGVVPDAWDRLCVFTRYATVSHVDSVAGLGVAGAAADAMLDTYSLLVFMQGDRVAAHVRYPLDKGEFAAPGPPHWYCLARERAVFQMRHPIEGGRPWVGPVDGTG